MVKLYKKEVVEVCELKELNMEAVVNNLQLINQDDIFKRQEKGEFKQSFGGFNYLFIEQTELGKDKSDTLVLSISEFEDGSIFKENATITIDKLTNNPVLVYSMNTEGLDLKKFDFTKFKGVIDGNTLDIESRDNLGTILIKDVEDYL